jgi:hypothetical protein
MKIAYCLAGHTREFDKIISITNQKFREMNDVDFYISTWIMSGENVTFWAGEKENDRPVDVESMFNLYRPLKFDMEGRQSYPELEKFDRKFTDTPVNAMNTLLMFKKISNSLEYPDQTYDVLVRSRFDIMDLVVNFKTCEENTIYGKLSSINGLPSDIFFYGDHDTMKKAVPNEDFYTDEILNNSKNAEDVFKKYLDSVGIKFIVDDTLNYKLKNVNY